MNNKKFFIVFISFWALLIILNFIVPSKEFSQNENRMLAKLPKFRLEELFDGKYVEKLNDYINDHFVFRDLWLKINATEEIALGKTENNGVYIGKDGYLFEKISYTAESEEKINKLVETINNRYKMYNEEVEKVIQLEKEKKIFVIRPSRTVGIKRIERDIDKIQEMYDLGKSDIQEKMDGLLNYLKE